MCDPGWGEEVVGRGGGGGGGGELEHAFPLVSQKDGGWNGMGEEGTVTSPSISPSTHISPPTYTNVGGKKKGGGNGINVSDPFPILLPF